MGQPYDLAVLIELLFLLIRIVSMKLQLRSDVESQKHLHFFFKSLSYNCALPRFSKFSTEIYLFIKFDFG
jgi:hypothetical protein